jgi:hypothetical protein
LQNKTGTKPVKKAEEEGFSSRLAYGVSNPRGICFAASGVLIPQNKKMLHPFTGTKPFSTEEEGFEPPVPFGTAVFKTATLSHSVTPPAKAGPKRADWLPITS